MLRKLRLVAFGTTLALSLTMLPAQAMQAAAAGIGPPAALTSQSSSTSEFPIPNSNSTLTDIAKGPDGNLWFTGLIGNKVGLITTGGSSTEFHIPSAGGPNGIAAGPDGNLWFTELYANGIGRITPGGVITEFRIPSVNGQPNGSQPNGIAAGPDGNLWFTEQNGNNVGRITTAGAITEFSIPTAGSSASGITAGPDGNLWFTEGVGKIGRITTAGAITEFPVGPYVGVGIAAGPDGNLWFAGATAIGRITTAGAITNFPIPSSGFASGIAADPDGNLWFTETNQGGTIGRIGRITTAGVITEFPISNSSSPGGITAGPDGNLWFTEGFNNSIGRITTGGAITEFPVPGEPGGISAGPDGNLWFTEAAGSIGRITTAGAITEFLIPSGITHPNAIAAGPDGNLWFTEQSGNKVGRITTTGAITEFPIPTVDSHPNGIAAGPDGNLWFTELTGDNIGRITTAGAITEFPIPIVSGVGAPIGITAGPDGNLWFTGSNDLGGIGRITTAGVVTVFPIPTMSGQATGIAAGPDGNLWFTEQTGNNIGRITTAGVVSEFPIPTAGNPIGIAAGPDGNLWFTNYGQNIGKITTAGVITEFPASGFPTGITAGPDGNLWFTEQYANQIARITPGASTNTTTVLTSAPNPSALGQAVTFTATVTSTTGQATPSGSVSLMEGTNTLASGTVDSSGMAQFTVSTLAAGAHSLTAAYAGSGSATASTSAPITQIVGVGPTTIAIASSVNPSVGGQNVTFTATVTATSPSSGTPSGIVTFVDGTTPLGSGPLDSTATATLSTATLAVGRHSITANYLGDTTFAGSTSAALTQTVGAAVTNTTTVLTSAPNPSVVGQPVTFTAIVSSSSGQTTPAGTVSLLEGSTTLASGTLDSSGRAQFTISTLVAGSHTLTAAYAGMGSAAASVSAPLTQLVTIPTAVAVASSVNPSVSGQGVTFTATVTPTGPSSSTPSGFVSFSDGTTPLGSGALASGKATLTTAALTAGTHSITASYPGDSAFASSTSATLTQTVNASLKLVINSSPVTLMAGTSSGLITVHLQNQSSTPVLAPSGGLNLLLNAASPTGSFRDAGDTTTISTAVIAGGSSSVQFRYRDTFAGAGSITVSTQTPAAATSATQSETVVPASLDHLSLRPATATVAPGTSKTYSAEGFDVYGNDIGDVTSATQFSVSPDGVCTGATCTIPTKGAHKVAGTDGAAIGTSTLIGDAGPVPTLTVTNSSGMASHTVTFNIGGSDADGDPLTYTIDYGDGTTASGSLPSAPLTHTYTSACHQCPIILTVSDGITQPPPYVVATVDIAPNQPLVAKPGDPLSIVLGQAAHLDGSNSSPAPPGIDSYTWNFGDGTSATGPVQDHVYPGPAPKTWTATLTVTGGGSSASATVNVNVLPAPTTSGLTINVTGDGPLAGATVVVENANNNIFNAVDKGGGVYTINGLPDGSYTVFGYKSGFVPNTASATINGGSGTTTLALTSGAVATTSLTATRLTAAQAAALGIDTTAPGNQNVYQFELHLAFGPGSAIAVSGVASASGFYSIGGAGGVGAGGTSCSLFCTAIVASAGGFTIIGNVAEISGDSPSIIWMIVPGKAQWLKELFDVRILITNLAPTPFTLSQGSATLNLPAGLSLAQLNPGLAAQQLTKPIADIPGQNSQGTDWLIRGDAEGFYSLSADYRAVLNPIGAPIRLHAQTVNQLHIWGASALRMTFDADDVAYAAYPYHIRVSLTNVADVPVFNPVVELVPSEGDPNRNYVFQPREQYDQGTAEIQPGSTFQTRDYIVAPRFTGTLDVSRSFVAPVGGNAGALTAVITSHSAASSYPYDIATIESNGVLVSWQPVIGAKGYQVFVTPKYAQDFPSNYAVQVGPSQTSALLPSGTHGLIAVSTLLIGVDGQVHNVLSHPVIGLSLADPASASVSCSPPTVLARGLSTCTATIADTAPTAPSTPTGSVAFSVSGSGSLSRASCVLSGLGASASCQVVYTAGATSSTDTITVSYPGDGQHAANSARTSVTVLAAEITALPLRLDVGRHFSGSLGLFSIPTVQGTTYRRGDFIVTVAWGDGSSSTANIVNVSPALASAFAATGRTAFQINASHTYQDASATQITITLKRSDGTLLATATPPVRLFTRHPSAYFVTNPSVNVMNGISLLVPDQPGPGQLKIKEYSWTILNGNPVIDNAKTHPKYDQLLSALAQDPGNTNLRQQAINMGILPVDANGGPLGIGGLSADRVKQLVTVWQAYFPYHIVPQLFDFFGSIGIQLVITDTSGVASNWTQNITIQEGCPPWGGPLSNMFRGYTICDTYNGFAAQFGPHRLPDYVSIDISAQLAQRGFVISGGVSLVITSDVFTNPDKGIFISVHLAGGVGGSSIVPGSVSAGWLGPPNPGNNPAPSDVDSFVHGLDVYAGCGICGTLGLPNEPPLGLGFQVIWNPGTGQVGEELSFPPSPTATFAVSCAASLSDLGSPVQQTAQQLYTAASTNPPSSSTIDSLRNDFFANLSQSTIVIRPLINVLAGAWNGKSPCT